MYLFRRQSSIRKNVVLLFGANLFAASLLQAETCITQSEMKPADRDAITATARRLASSVQGNDSAGLQRATLPEYANDFSNMSSVISNTAPKLAGASLQVEQVYVLDASTLKTLGDGTNQDAQFFCSLNKSMAEANFLIPALPPGRYAFAMVNAGNIKAPWRLSFLLKQTTAVAGQEAGWSMAGFYPKPLTAAGHDGIWYWTNARDMAKNKQLWTAYLYYQQAQALLQPVGFVTSTHFDNLRKEIITAAPPALSQGISATAPLVVKSASGTEYRFTDLTTDDSFGASKVDVVAHLASDALPEALPNDKQASSGRKATGPPFTSPRDRNAGAMAALVAAYPELRGSFHGVAIFAEATGKSPFITEEPMSNIP